MPEPEGGLGRGLVSLPGLDTDHPEVRRRIARLRAFRPTRAAALENAAQLACLLHVRGDPRANVVLDSLAQIEFEGNFNFWSPLERALALRAYRSSGIAERRAVRHRLTSAGINPERLKGSLLPIRRDAVKSALASGDSRSVLENYVTYLQELVFLFVARDEESKDLASEIRRVEGVLQNLLGRP